MTSYMNRQLTNALIEKEEEVKQDEKTMYSSLSAHFVSSFKGKIYQPGMEEYNIARKKSYAYNSKYADQMYPALYVYPDNCELKSIQAAIELGQHMNLHVMGRSGGHQYCGVSSDNGSIIVDMQEWNTMSPVLNSSSIVLQSELAEKYPKMVTVGVGVQLGDLAHHLGESGCTIPMGECPSVCVGGHMQSGGWGHLNRSCGLFTEYVYGFTIVTAEGVKTVSCESTGRELDLYNAVRGGSPGAFGIVTDATLLLLSDNKFPNVRGYGQIVPIYDSDDQEDGPFSKVISMVVDIFNKYGDSSEALGVNLECSILVQATPEKYSKFLLQSCCLLPRELSQNVKMLLVEATILDDTDPSSMRVFQEIIDVTEQARRASSHRYLNLNINALIGLMSPGTLKNGRTRMPLSTLNKTFVRDKPFLRESSDSRIPTKRVNEQPAQFVALYPKAEAYLPTGKFLYGSDDAITKGARRGFIEIFKSVSKNIGPDMPLNELAAQFMLFGTKRNVGPFASSVPWLTKLRGTFGFDHFGTLEGLSDPRTWQNIQAFNDLEREYMIKSQDLTPVGMTSFTFDTEGDTSQGGRCSAVNGTGNYSLDLTRSEVQKKYYDPESDRGLEWLSGVKYDWDSGDIFHSRFTVPPRQQTDSVIYTAVPF